MPLILPHYINFRAKFGFMSQLFKQNTADECACMCALYYDFYFCSFYFTLFMINRWNNWIIIRPKKKIVSLEIYLNCRFVTIAGSIKSITEQFFFSFANQNFYPYVCLARPFVRFRIYIIIDIEWKWHDSLFITKSKWSTFFKWIGNYRFNWIGIRPILSINI